MKISHNIGENAECTHLKTIFFVKYSLLAVHSFAMEFSQEHLLSQQRNRATVWIV